MAKKSTQTEITPRCDYCKQNAGENKDIGYMWNCETLGCGVPFGYTKIVGKETLHCKAMVQERGLFVLDKARYKEHQLKGKQ